MRRLKIFTPIAVLAWAVLVPVNWTNNTLEIAKQLRNVTSSDIDKLSVSNIPEYSMRCVRLFHSRVFYVFEQQCLDFFFFFAFPGFGLI